MYGNFIKLEFVDETYNLLIGSNKKDNTQQKLRKQKEHIEKDFKNIDIIDTTNLKQENKDNKNKIDSTLIDIKDVSVKLLFKIVYLDKNDKRTKYYKCNFCEKMYERKVSIVNHQKQNICDASKFKSKTQDDNLFRRYNCEVCDFSCVTRSTLSKHKKSHLHDPTCTYCQKMFESIDHLTEHVSQEHRTSEWLMMKRCHFCLKTYKDQLLLDKHVTESHAKQPICDLCGKQCFDAKRYSTHYKRCYKKLNRPGKKCGICGQVFGKDYNLIYHVQSHEGIACEICGKLIKNAKNLKTHLMIHAGEKPFACQICEKRFTRKDVLKHHVRVHTGEKPYECQTCGQKFARATNLHIHERYHKNEKRFKCDICDRAYVTRSILLKHQKLSHRIAT